VRALVVLALLLAGLALAGDRVAESLVESAVQTRLSAEGFERPSVEMGGFPFLTQAVRGRYGEVRVRAAAAEVGEGRVRGVRAVLRDVRTGGDGVRIGSGTARATVPYAQVRRALDAPTLMIEPGPDGQVRVSRSVEVLSREITASGLAELTARGDRISVAPTEVRLPGAGLVDDALSAAVEDRLTFTYRVPDLPEGIDLRRVEPGRNGFLVTAAADSLVLTGG
jgi:hypothetical protein